MGEDWVAHANDVAGETIAEGLTARNAIIRRDCSFLDREVAFGSVEERIRTRLGDEGVTVTFEPPPASPFDDGLPIPQVSIPYHLSRGLTPEDPVATTPTGDGFEFHPGQRPLPLRPAGPAAGRVTRRQPIPIPVSEGGHRLNVPDAHGIRHIPACAGEFATRDKTSQPMVVYPHGRCGN